MSILRNFQSNLISLFSIMVIGVGLTAVIILGLAGAAVSLPRNDVCL